jgi:hypothetical protein
MKIFKSVCVIVVALHFGMLLPAEANDERQLNVFCSVKREVKETTVTTKTTTRVATPRQNTESTTSSQYVVSEEDRDLHFRFAGRLVEFRPNSLDNYTRWDQTPQQRIVKINRRDYEITVAVRSGILLESRDRISMLSLKNLGTAQTVTYEEPDDMHSSARAMSLQLIENPRFLESSEDDRVIVTCKAER